MDTIADFEKIFHVEDGEFKNTLRPSGRIGSQHHKTANQAQKVASLVLYCFKCEKYIEPKVRSSIFSYTVSCLNEGCDAKSEISVVDLMELVQLSKQQ